MTDGNRHHSELLGGSLIKWAMAGFLVLSATSAPASENQASVVAAIDFCQQIASKETFQQVSGWTITKPWEVVDYGYDHGLVKSGTAGLINERTGALAVVTLDLKKAPMTPEKLWICQVFGPEGDDEDAVLAEYASWREAGLLEGRLAELKKSKFAKPIPADFFEKTVVCSIPDLIGVASGRIASKTSTTADGGEMDFLSVRNVGSESCMCRRVGMSEMKIARFLDCAHKHGDATTCS